jgi:hypothetical protein
MVKGKLPSGLFASSIDDACHGSFVGRGPPGGIIAAIALEPFHGGKIVRLN